jgi:hypothetical protein
MAVAMSKTSAATTGKRAQMLIDGSWVDTSGNEISVESPGNRQIIASIPRGGDAQTQSTAFPSSPSLTVNLKSARSVVILVLLFTLSHCHTSTVWNHSLLEL